MNTPEEIIKKLGYPRDNTSNLVRLQLPFPMVLAWDIKVTVTSFLCHPLIHDKLSTVYENLLKVYGLPKIKELRIDRFGGCYAYRMQRESTNKWSSHSWAIAVDHDPERNQLKWNKSKASFAKPEYMDMMAIWYDAGFYNLGYEKDYDWMHFEYDISKLK